LSPAVRGRHAVVVERPRYLGEASSARVLEPDSLDDPSRQRWWPACGAAFTGLARRLKVLAEKALELGDRDQPLAPGRLDRVDSRDDAAVNGGDADAERFGGLFAAVGEPFGLDDLLQLAGRCPDQLRLGAAMA
jgi:hypothetical protein